MNSWIAGKDIKSGITSLMFKEFNV